MANPKKENVHDREGVEILSVVAEKRQYILEELSELMENMGGIYSPFLMEELQRHLEFVIQNFNEEVQAMIKVSFKKWKIKDSHIRDLMSGNIKMYKSQRKMEKPEDSSIPDFIKDMEYGPIRPK